MDLSLKPETATLIDALLAAPYGETITFADLSAALGRDVRRQPSPLPSARRIAERDHNALFASVRGVGLRRMSPDEVSVIGAGGRRRIRRGARRAVTRMGQLVKGANALPAEAQRDMSREIAALNLIAHISEDRSTAALSDGPNAPPPAKAATAFLRHIGAQVETDGGEA